MIYRVTETISGCTFGEMLHFDDPKWFQEIQKLAFKNGNFVR